MAISINNFVNISSAYPSSDVAGRAFGGLVITKQAMIAPNVTGDGDGASTGPEGDTTSAESDPIYTDYTSGRAMMLSLAQVKTYFGAGSKEYEFANGYYSYISPSGRFASKLTFALMKDGEDEEGAFTRIIGETNNFGSFTFLEDPQETAALVKVATFNATGNLKGKFLFVVNDVRGSQDAATVADKCAAFSAISGCCFVSGKTDCSAFMPMAILASTDYDDGSVTNFMFKQFSTEEPTVADDATYTKFNAGFVNFYGRTQTNGQTIDFYQRGFNTDSTDTAVYCNEMWFKSICETALIQESVSTERIPANDVGVSLVSLKVSEQCAYGVNNGMFMRKTLTNVDIRDLREKVNNMGGSTSTLEDIVTSLETVGYAVYTYLDFAKDDRGGRLAPTGEYYIHYYVFYGTADNVRYIEGDNLLIK